MVGAGGERLPGSAVHLLRLSRGLTPAIIQDVAFSACGTLLTLSSARGTTHIFRLALPGEHNGSHPQARLALFRRQNSCSHILLRIRGALYTAWLHSCMDGAIVDHVANADIGAAGSAPPHLVAAQHAASSGSGHAPPKAARLGAVGRVRHTGLLNGVIPGSSAAAAAVSLYNGNAGMPADQSIMKGPCSSLWRESICQGTKPLCLHALHPGIYILQSPLHACVTMDEGTFQLHGGPYFTSKRELRISEDDVKPNSLVAQARTA